MNYLLSLRVHMCVLCNHPVYNTISKLIYRRCVTVAQRPMCWICASENPAIAAVVAAPMRNECDENFADGSPQYSIHFLTMLPHIRPGAFCKPNHVMRPRCFLG